MAPKQPPIVLPPNLTLEKLVPVQQMLHLTVYRNKNQHRITKWWGSLQLLRRNIKRLVQMLGSEEAEYRRGKEALLKMSSWVVAEIIPRTYLSFSAVVADNQYASLGLMLMGCLARFNACVSFPRSRVPSEEAELRMEMESTRTNAVIPSEDFGEAITREKEKFEEEIVYEAGLGKKKDGKGKKRSDGDVGEELSRPAKSGLKREVLDVETSSEEEERQPAKKVKKIKKVSRKFVEEFDHLSGNSSDEEVVIPSKRAKVAERSASLSDTSDSAEEIKPVMKKVKKIASSSKAAKPVKKKKKKGGDDFDDLFASLM